MEIISIFNNKGGVAKTTTAMNTGVSLSKDGYKVLLVDCDAQGNLTRMCSPEAFILTVKEWINEEATFEECVQKYDENVDFMPANIKLSVYEMELTGAFARERFLKDAIDKIKDNYDYIIIDCPPSLGTLAINGLVACSKLVVPVKTQTLSLEGLDTLVSVVKKMSSKLNPNLEVLGVLPTVFDSRNKMDLKTLKKLQEDYSYHVFEPIRMNVKVAEAVDYNKSVIDTNPTCNGAMDYINFSKKISGGIKNV